MKDSLHFMNNHTQNDSLGIATPFMSPVLLHRDVPGFAEIAQTLMLDKSEAVAVIIDRKAVCYLHDWTLLFDYTICGEVYRPSGGKYNAELSLECA